MSSASSSMSWVLWIPPRWWYPLSSVFPRFGRRVADLTLPDTNDVFRSYTACLSKSKMALSCLWGIEYWSVVVSMV